MRRRHWLRVGAAALLPLPGVLRARVSAPRVVVIGGGFAGTACARALKHAQPQFNVTLIERDPVYIACPLSNSVIAGQRPIAAQRFGHAALAAAGVTLLAQDAVAVDAAAQSVTLADGTRLGWDRLVLAPGIALRWDAIEGYDEAAAQVMPHAWLAGEQTLLLQRQLQAMDDGGLVVISVPHNPMRCPVAPYERASLIAHGLKARKPRSKLLVLDAKDAFPQQAQFLEAWRELFPGLVDWIGLSGGGEVNAVEPGTRTLVTDFERHRAAVANVIPPQKAGRIAELAGVTDRSGWCPVDALSFESKQRPKVHVIGDAAQSAALPKSASGAVAQAEACANAVAALLLERPLAPARLDSACYSLFAPGQGLSIRGSYTPVDGQWAEVAGSAQVSTRAARQAEALAGDEWFKALTTRVFA
jgi:NADPH-dependent 2,4-dienoyl-CoA reductase/sulfur reductase-like enzyme